MRARPREINIFNMSLLDILCGALGAFCFMMLAALPHYVAPGTEVLLVKNREETQRLLKEAEKWKELLNDPAAAGQLQDLLDRLSGQLKQMEGQVNKYANDNVELKTENEKLTAENTRQATRLEQKKPFLIVSTALDTEQSIEIYLADDMAAENTGKSANAAFNPMGSASGSGWRNDLVAFIPGRGVAMWMTSEVPANAHYRIYLKLANKPGERKSTVLSSSIFGNLPGEKNFESLSPVTVSPAQFWAFLGVITIDEKYNPVFREATEAEREEDWKTIMKAPRPPLITSTPEPAAPSAAPVDILERERIRRDRLRERTQRASATPAPQP